MKRSTCAALVALLAALLMGGAASAQVTAKSPAPVFRSMPEYADWVQANHKAPFDRDGVRLPEGAAALIMKLRNLPAAALATSATWHNTKINRDRDPWPKAEVGMAVDPVSGNVVVMTNDFRENWDHEFYHVSTNGGTAWSDDSMVGGSDPNTGYVQLTFQSDPGVAFDSKGHSFLSAITGNSIADFYDLNDNYANFDTQIIVTQGYNHGTYTNLAPIVVDTQPCRYFPTVSVCPAALDKPLITVDNVAGSPHNGTIYVYYTVFCNDKPCPYGSGNIPAFGSAIVESHSAGPGSPFSAPQIVSGTLFNEQFSYMVVDSHGVPHMFFDDFTSSTGVNMYMSSLTSTGWVVTSSAVATFLPAFTATSNWGFRLSGTFAPGCGIAGDTAYCAFSANQVGSGPFEGGLSVYLAAVNTHTGASKINRVNNDPFNNSADHIFPWATTKADGSVYVGFYDDRNDPFLTKVMYWVAKSTDGGKTFPTQMEVSDTAFNPCVGFPGCGFFGDYTQIVAGPNGVVHAAWSDTRDGASMQVYGQAITW